MSQRGGRMGGRGFNTAQPIFINGTPIINNLQAAANFAVSLNSYETITQSLYDSQAYPAAGTNQLTFFQNQIGQGAGVISGQPKTLEDTNMQAGGQMPAQQAYIITSVEVEFQPGVPGDEVNFDPTELPSVLGATAVANAVNDTYIFRATGWLNINISSKSYLNEGPLMKFPASNDFEVQGAASNQTTPAATLNLATLYGKAVGTPYILSPNNLLLIPTMNFNCTLNWATVEPIHAAARVFVRFMGQLMRPAQ